ncbi:TPA: hypothetical protein DF272_06700 [Candidatus Falkowbacteria bacterium]|nr:hypothetical protein [Candidatus Falkowbacteria bacterium]
MPKKIVLYDLRKWDYPRRRGDVFRSLQVFKCPVCGALSNLVIMGGHPGYGVRVICPSSSACWHHELEFNIKKLKLTENEPVKLHSAIGELRIQCREKVKSDLVGEYDLSLKRTMTNTFSTDRNNRDCTHDILTMMFLGSLK